MDFSNNKIDLIRFKSIATTLINTHTIRIIIYRFLIDVLSDV